MHTRYCAKCLQAATIVRMAYIGHVYLQLTSTGATGPVLWETMRHLSGEVTYLCLQCAQTDGDVN